jgi:EAL domain-containing protein (putative c-di-GMP-specific phosphodiesterase class I)
MKKHALSMVRVEKCLKSGQGKLGIMVTAEFQACRVRLCRSAVLDLILRKISCATFPQIKKEATVHDCNASFSANFSAVRQLLAPEFVQRVIGFSAAYQLPAPEVRLECQIFKVSVAPFKLTSSSCFFIQAHLPDWHQHVFRCALVLLL